MTSIQSRREGGFTLLELLLVIGVAALLLIGGIATYRLVSEGNRATEATRLLLTLRQEANVFAQQQGGVYTNITYNTRTDTAATNIFVASGILRQNQRNPFNGDIDIAPVTPGGGTADSELTITFSNLSRAGCVKLFTAITNPNEITNVNANGKGARDAQANAITAAQAAQDCDVAVNEIVWQVK